MSELGAERTKKILTQSAKYTFPRPQKLRVPNPSPFDPSRGTNVPITHPEEIKFRLIPEHVVNPPKRPETLTPKNRLS